jgi:poly(3-hydroxybutyrate) depolymerase
VLRQCVLVFFAALLFASVASAQLIQQSTTFNGLERIWFVHVPPSYDGSRAVPLVVALHGSGGSGDALANVTRWNEKADQAGFIVVYPNASASVGNIWNIFFLVKAPDDVAWLAELLQRLQQAYSIDRMRIYMTGFSNGASMVTTFGAVHSELLAAIAPLSGHWITTFYPPTIDSEILLDVKRPLPVWIWRGSLENFVTGYLRRDVQDQQAKQFWMGVNRAFTTAPSIHDGIYTTEVYQGSAEVRFTEVAGLGHEYDPQATAMIWDQFFVRMHLPPVHRRAVRH